MNHSIRSTAQKWAVCLLFALLMQGCASNLETPLTLTEPPHWQETLSRLSVVDHWEFSGKIGVKIPERIDSAVINRWQQADTQFTIDLSSAIFGLGATRIEGTPSYIVITESGEKPITSYQPTKLIEQHIGWPLPIAKLRYWIKGMPAPIHTTEDQIKTLQFNDSGELSLLSQNGWQISYAKYSLFHNINLPRKVVLRQQQAKITVIINEWQLL